MKKVRKVAILGAGAIGSYFASRFFDTPGFTTVLIAKGRRYERLKASGLVVNGKSYVLPVIHPEEATSPADLIIVALKHHYLKEAIHDFKKMVGDPTIIMSVMNGLDSEEYIGSIYGMEKILYAISVGIDAVRQGNQTYYTKPGKHYFGEAVNARLSQKALRVKEAFDKAGIINETPKDMIRMLWWKFMVNVGMNQASAVMRASYGLFQTSPEVRGLMEALMKEVIALTDVIGINLTTQDIEEWYPFLKLLSPQGKTSMLQDIEARRKTEVEIFGGKVVELGKKYHVPTSVNQTVYQIIRLLERHPN